jgi:hypothetical protein
VPVTPSPAPAPRHPSTPRSPGEAAPSVSHPIACPPGWIPGPLGRRCWPVGRGRGAPLPSGRAVPPPSVRGR